MHQFHTTRGQRFIDLAADFAQRAAQHDEDESFPYENYARLEHSGYTIMTIPEELGGNGACLLERMKAQERPRQGCGPTALAINMHFNAVRLLIDLWRKFQDSKRADILRQIAAERLICGGSASEPDNAIPVLRPRATAERVDGGWRVSGRKNFSTQSIALDRYFSEALWQEGPAGKLLSPSSFRPTRPASHSRMTGTPWACAPLRRGVPSSRMFLCRSQRSRFNDRPLLVAISPTSI